MSKKHHPSRGWTGLAAVTIASGCCSLVTAACAAHVGSSSTVAPQAVASTGQADSASPGNAGSIVEPAAGREESADTPRSASPGSRTPDPTLTRGAELFAKNCTICHGENGDGAGKFAYLMNPRPRDFRQGDFKLATTQNQIPTADDLVRTIS
ncbi:MAG: c-type cytochrome, partial [Phycisphaerae bacterium]